MTSKQARNTKMNVIRSILSSHLFRNAVFVGSSYAISECAQQQLFGESHDTARILRMAIWGFFIYGPGNYGWYKVLDRFLPGNTIKTAMKKVVLEKVTISPIWCYTFFVVQSLFERKSEVLSEANEKALPAFVIGLSFWIPAQTLNFLLVPHIYRVVYLGAAGFVWANFLCLMKRNNAFTRAVSQLEVETG